MLNRSFTVLDYFINPHERSVQKRRGTMYKIYETLIKIFSNTYVFYSIQAENMLWLIFVVFKCGTV